MVQAEKMSQTWEFPLRSLRLTRMVNRKLKLIMATVLAKVKRGQPESEKVPVRSRNNTPESHLIYDVRTHLEHARFWQSSRSEIP